MTQNGDSDMGKEVNPEQELDLSNPEVRERVAAAMVSPKRGPRDYFEKDGVRMYQDPGEEPRPVSEILPPPDSDHA